MTRYITDADIEGTTFFGDDSLFVDSFAINSKSYLNTIVKEFFDGNVPEEVKQEEIVTPMMPPGFLGRPEDNLPEQNSGPVKGGLNA